jgi:hypothetical protein
MESMEARMGGKSGGIDKTEKAKEGVITFDAGHVDFGA